MKTRFPQRTFLIALACTLLAAFTFPVHAAKKAKTEDELIAELASPKEDVVVDAMLRIEREYPTSAKAIAELKKYLTDQRPKVRRKAARVLGVLHADVTSEEIKSICALLKASDHREIMDGLIALRGLKAAEALPEITPLLQHIHPNVIRDACRTIAVHGNKEHISLIEPLLEHKEKSVKKDAQDAIFALKNK